MFFDTHAHLDDTRFDNVRDSLISSFPENGITKVLNAGADMPSSKKGVVLARKYPFIYCSVGVHPHDAKDMTTDDLADLKRLAAFEKVRAIGEIGLDYHYDFSPRETQKYWFEKQIELSIELGLPVIIHNRESISDCLNILIKYKNLKGVVHCFSESIETLKTVLDMGLYISIGGVVTFSNAKRVVEAAKIVPLDRLLIETDSPYLTPVPFRGKLNNPTYVRLVAEKIAEIREMQITDIANITYENGCRLFDIKD